MAVLPAFFGLLLFGIVSGQVIDIQPQEAVRRVGDHLEVLCKVRNEIDSCRMLVGNSTYRLDPSSTDINVIYAGGGFGVGECGALIKNIREEWNGNITCILPPPVGSSIEITASMRLVVARAPGDPYFVAPPEAALTENDILMIQCVVPDGRPAAKITWFLNDTQELDGLHQSVLTPPDRDIKTISQNMTRTVRADDDGKFLTCKAEHAALDAPKEVKRQLIVHYPPKRLESNSITIFGLKLNEPGALNITVRANPPPKVEWSAGDQALYAMPSQNDRFIVNAPLLLGNGYYNITLTIKQLTKEDVDRPYYLRVSNDLGNEQFTIRISTLDEPAGVELGAGGIVGIVIAVLILLIAVSLVVFAFATARWCFAGRRRDSTKHSGESDTESAAGGRGERVRARLAGLSARVRAALPKGKDKVQATEAQPETEEKEPEDKVVYAQLALSEQTSTEKPPPPSTEYAEIVYSDRPGVQREVKE